MGAQGLGVLPVPLLLAGAVAVVAVGPGVAGAPGVLVEQRGGAVDGRGARGDRRAVGNAEQLGVPGHGLRLGEGRLPAPGGGQRDGAGADAVDPPVAPVAPVGLQAVPDPLLRVLEEVLVAGGAQPRVRPLLVPAAHGVGDDAAGRAVVRELAEHPQMQDVPRVRVRRAGQVEGGEAGDAAPLVGVREAGQGAEVGGQQVVDVVVGLVEAEDRALHVGQAVRGVGAPHQDAVAARRLPAEQPGQVLPADEVGHGAARPVAVSYTHL